MFSALCDVGALNLSPWRYAEGTKDYAIFRAPTVDILGGGNGKAFPDQSWIRAMLSHPKYNVWEARVSTVGKRMSTLTQQGLYRRTPERDIQSLQAYEHKGGVIYRPLDDTVYLQCHSDTIEISLPNPLCLAVVFGHEGAYSIELRFSSLDRARFMEIVDFARKLEMKVRATCGESAK